MKIKANVSFCGERCMKKGEVIECSKTEGITSLLKAGYISEIKDDGISGTKKAKGKKDKTDEG